MQVEGRGKVAPTPIVIQLSDSDITRLSEAAAKREGYRDYARSDSTWKRGLNARAPFVGLCGEDALCSFLNRRLGVKLSPDISLREWGDGGTDIELFGLSLQVKTRVTATTNLVRRIDDKRRIRSLDAPVFVFTSFDGHRTVSLIGWNWSRRLPDIARMEKSRRGDWWNLCVSDCELLSMGTLVDELESRREA